MLQYLVILLDDTSVSYCHYDNRKSEHRLISLENLKEGILFAMKENVLRGGHKWLLIILSHLL